MGFSHLPICRNSLTCRRFEPLRAIRMLVFKHRATSNRESSHRVLCDPAPAETDGTFKTNAEWPKGPADHLALRQPSIRTSQVCNVRQLTDV